MAVVGKVGLDAAPSANIARIRPTQTPLSMHNGRMDGGRPAEREGGYASKLPSSWAGRHHQLSRAAIRPVSHPGRLTRLTRCRCQHPSVTQLPRRSQREVSLGQSTIQGSRAPRVFLQQFCTDSANVPVFDMKHASKSAGTPLHSCSWAK